MRKFTKLMRLMMVVVLSLTMVVGFAQRVDLRTDTAPKQSPAKAAIEQQKMIKPTMVVTATSQTIVKEQMAVTAGNEQSSGSTLNYFDGPAFVKEVYYEKPISNEVYDPNMYPAPKQGGETVATALAIGSLPYTDAGTTSGYINDYDEACPYTGGTAPDVCYSYTPAANGSIDIDLCASSYDTKVFVYQNSVTPGFPYACNDDYYYGAPCYVYSSAIFGMAVTAGNTYYIIIDGYGANSGAYSMTVTGGGGGGIVNDNCADAIAIGEVTNLPFTTVGSTNDGGGTCMTSGNIWYDYTATASGDLTVDLCGSTFDTKLAIYDGFTCLGTNLGCNDDAGPACATTQSSILIPGITAGQQFKIEVGGYSAYTGPGDLTVSVAGPCVVTCPPGGILEGEPDILDEGVDVTNGGCNSTPNVFLPILDGQTICGNWNTYLYTPPGGTLSEYRDTDWYELDLTGAPGNTIITWTVTAEFPSAALILGGPCPGTVLTSATAAPCAPATCTWTVAPGIYWLFAGGNVFNGYPAGGDWDYTATVTTAPAGATPYNDECTGAIVQTLLDGVPATFTGDNTGATQSTPSFPMPDVWEAFTLTGAANVVLDYCTSGGGTPWGNAWLNLSLDCPTTSFSAGGAFNTTTCGDGNVTITWTGLAAGTYWYPVMLDPTYGSVGPYTIHVVATYLTGGTGCENTSPYGTATVDPTGLLTTISTCSYAGEYSTVNGIVAGLAYQFTMSNLGTGAYITITDGPGTSGNILAFGPSPLSYVAASSGTLYAHWSLNEFCATENLCHVTTVQGPCAVTCPVGALQENEPEIPDEGVDVTNAGCNMLPATPLFMPIAFGDTYCGKTNTYLVGTTQRRDTDWYRIDLSTPACNWWNITFTAKAEFDLQILLLNAGTPEDCSNDVVVASAVVAPCDVATITGDFPSGVYYFWVGPSVFTGYPIATGPHDYVATLTGSLLGYSQISPAPPAAITVTLPPAGSTTQNLTIGNSGTYQLDYTASTTGAWTPVTGDNFDSYIAGQQLACQAPAAWTTWSNAPCSATEDGYVSNTYAYNGANSAKIVLNNDQVKLLGGLSSGVYKFSFMQYIPSTKSGYFNTLSDFAFPAGPYYWAFECYFNAGGGGALTANHTTIPFTWTPDVWKKVEVIVDLDNDVAEFIYDGALVYSWPWTQGATAGVGTLTIDAHDFFGAVATDEMYIDDYKLEFAGNDWLTLNGGLGVNGTVASGGPAANVTLGFNAGSYPVGTYTKTINMSTNELCGAKNSYAINVTMYVGYAITGNVYYGPTNGKPMTSIGTITQVICTPGPTVTTGAGGAYDIRPLAGGATYLLTGFTNKPGTATQITGADYIIVNRMAAGLGTPYTNLQYRAGDVNKSNSVTASDAILIKRRAAGLSSTWAAPVYVFDGPFPATPILGGLPVIIGASNVVQDFRTLLSGDMNGSHTPAP